MGMIITAQGHLLKASDTTRKEAKNKVGGVRGVVDGMSRASRRRLLRLMATLEVESQRVVFVTLTYHGFPSHKRSKQNLKAFFMRVTRKFPQASGVWRLEQQQRGSIHFHILFFNLPYWKYDDLQKAWTEITGEDISGIDIGLVNDHKHAMLYVGKYIAKVDNGSKKLFTLQSRIMHMARTQRNMRYPAQLATIEPNEPQKRVKRIFRIVSFSELSRLTKLGNGAYRHAHKSKTGRIWGIFNRKALPYAPMVVAVIHDRQMENYLKYHMKSESRIAFNSDSRTFCIFTDEAREILNFALNNADYSGTNAYQHIRIVQKAITHAERMRSKIPRKFVPVESQTLARF